MKDNRIKDPYDIIIIGSGAGGLSAGICLAKEGKSVLILEQHYVPGGWCHSFLLNGQQFSPGLHYVGQLDEGEPFRKMLEGLDVAKDMVFFKMVEQGFEHARVGNVHFDYPSDPAEFKQKLIEQFPHEEKGIEKYLSVVWKTQTQLNELAANRSLKGKIGALARSRTLIRFGLKTLESVVSKYIKDKDLQAILNIQCGDHGVYPNEASFAYHCGVMGHYNKGGYFPMGGGSALVKAMTNVLKKHGAEIRTKESVRRILTKDGCAYGVQLESGEMLFANQIVSNADPHVTYTRLLDKDRLSKKLQKKLDNTTYSVSSLMAFLTVEMDVRSAGIDSGNYWIAATNEINGMMTFESLEDITKAEKFRGLFISCSTLKDPSHQDKRYYNFEIITFIDNHLFDELKGKKTGDEEYAAFKEKVSHMFLNNLEDLIPGVRDKVVQMELGTPNTNRHYINATKGNVYGIEKKLKQIGPGSYSAKSEIKDLFLCGSSTLAHGVAGAMNSGIMTAAEILKCEPADLLNPQSEETIRIYSAEDESEWPDWLKEKMERLRKRSKTIDPHNFLEHSDPIRTKELERMAVEATDSVPVARA